MPGTETQGKKLGNSGEMKLSANSAMTRGREKSKQPSEEIDLIFKEKLNLLCGPQDKPKGSRQ